MLARPLANRLQSWLYNILQAQYGWAPGLARSCKSSLTTAKETTTGSLVERYTHKVFSTHTKSSSVAARQLSANTTIADQPHLAIPAWGTILSLRHWQGDKLVQWLFCHFATNVWRRVRKEDELDGDLRGKHMGRNMQKEGSDTISLTGQTSLRTGPHLEL